MTPEEFTAAALACPEAEQGAHQRATDFRVKGKIFATYDASKDLGALNLLPEQQANLMARSDAFFPANGSWGARGWTKIKLSASTDRDVHDGLMMAWIKTAPKSLVKAQQGG